jgi:hypothetical protein
LAERPPHFQRRAGGQGGELARHLAQHEVDDIDGFALGLVEGERPAQQRVGDVGAGAA